MDARRLAKNREQVRAFNTGAYARLEKLFQPSRQAAQRKLQNVREEVEEFQDRLKFVLAGLKRGEMIFFLAFCLYLIVVICLLSDVLKYERKPTHHNIQVQISTNIY